MQIPLLIEFILGPLVLVTLLRVTAPYGRHFKPGWGPALPNRLAWLLMELPALVLIAVMVLSEPAARHAGALVPLCFWCVHYGYRSFVFPLLMRPSQRTFPAQLIVYAIAFNILNGYNNGVALLGDASAAWLNGRFVFGAAMFVAGFIMHLHADAIIRNLRRPGERGYKIPEGGMFRWVGSPHYLGEILQWCGWAIMTWSLAGLAFALFTACNLVPRAIANQRWYLQNFSDYPTGRKILIPGIF